jgi:hypothetical protein
MSDPIVIYSNGEIVESDSEVIYNPFPEPPESSTDEDSQELQAL